MADNGNGRVALAERLVRIEGGLDAMRGEQQELRAYLAQVVAELKHRDEDKEGRLRAVELAVTRHSEKLNLAATAQAVFTLVASAVAAWIGKRP